MGSYPTQYWSPIKAVGCEWFCPSCRQLSMMSPHASFLTCCSSDCLRRRCFLLGSGLFSLRGLFCQSEDPESAAQPRILHYCSLYQPICYWRICHLPCGKIKMLCSVLQRQFEEWNLSRPGCWLRWRLQARSCCWQSSLRTAANALLRPLDHQG